MKKLFPYILIVSIIVQLLAPFSVGVGVKNNLEVVSNKAEAEGGLFGGEYGITVNPIASVTKKSISIETKVSWGTSTNWLTQEMVFVSIKGADGNSQSKEVTLGPSHSINQSGTVMFDDLKENTTYYVYIKATQNGLSFLNIWENLVGAIPKLVGNWIGADNWPIVSSFFEFSGNEGEVTNIENPYEITTDSTKTINLDTLMNKAAFMPVCEITDLKKTLGGCIGIGLYKLIFVPSSFIFAKTGQLLDFTVGYSVRDQSYRSGFVVEGWGVLRDFCNMFFIFILLYIAFKTILGLAGGKTKEMIINVVIIGLLINFSLFATQVIIDASNILTRVFYNSETIKVGPKINGVVQEKKGPAGELKLSEALVAKVNPQNLIINASTVGDLQVKDPLGTDTVVKGQISQGTFILVVLLASAINIVGLIVFLTCSLLFITRVIGLWMAMIFAPLAFFSYTIPALQDKEMIGWKKWWPNTLSLAFMAPVFVFFMYLIIMFLETGLGLSDASSSWSTDKIDFVLKTFVPFIFIMILLVKAKGIAVKMSGEMGEMVSKVGAAAGGLALAAATGGTAMAMRGTVGRLGNKIATSKWASTNGAFGRGVGNLGKWTAGKSFDVRSTKLGAMAGKGMDVDMGKAKEGGYAKHLSEKVESRQKRAKELEVHENEPLKQSLNKTEMDLQTLLNENKSELDGIDKAIEKARANLKDAKDTGNTHDQTIYSTQLEAFKNQRKSLVNGEDMTGRNIEYFEDDGSGGLSIKRIEKNYKDGGTNSDGSSYGSTRTSDGVGGTISIDGLEKKQREDKKKIEDENRTRKNDYARSKARWGGRANKEAEHKIIMETKLDSGTKT